MKPTDFKLERYFAKYEFSAPYLLCTSDCQSFRVEELLALEEGAEEGLKKLWLGYTEPQGNPDLRGEIARLYTNTPAEHILVFAGGEEGIFVLVNTLLEPGDHVIVQSPCYQSLVEVARAAGCGVTQWHMDPARNWELDMDFLKDHISPRTRAIVVNVPNNPTGYMMPRDVFDSLIDIARQHGITIFCDEVYRFLEYDREFDLEYDHTHRLPMMCDAYENGVSLGVMSKSFGLPGLRIGWLASRDESLIRRMGSFKDYTSICCSAPSEFLATLALRNKDHLLKRNLDIIKDNLQLLEIFFHDYAHWFQWHKPCAGPLVFPCLTADDVDDDNRGYDDIGNNNIYNNNIYNNGMYGNHIRFGFGRSNMPGALEKLREYLDE